CCWIVQNTSDSLRFVFIRDINNPADSVVVDTCVYYPSSVVTNIGHWGTIDSTSNLSTYKYLRAIVPLPDSSRRIVFEPMGMYPPTDFEYTTVSYWGRNQRFHLVFNRLFDYTDCNQKRHVESGELPEVDLAEDVRRLLCRAKSLGAFQDAFVVLK